MKYEARAGDRIEGTFRAMVGLANKHSMSVECEFNDSTLIARPGDNAEQLHADWSLKMDKSRADYEASPEGIRVNADAKAAQELAASTVKTILETTEFRWSGDMREISGFGGGYEATCRAMVSAGVAWLTANHKADPKFRGYEGVTGVLIDDNDDAKALSKAILDASGGDCTGAMHQFSVSHALHAHKIGWPAYVAMMLLGKSEEPLKEQGE